MKWLIISSLVIGACLFFLINITDLSKSCEDKQDILIKVFVYSFIILVGFGVFGIAIVYTVLL